MSPSKTTTSTATTVSAAASTAAEAATYQQLRAHLATLKLHATAEHLPGVLEAARPQDLSMTATLERLLSLEVADTGARRLRSRQQGNRGPTASRVGFAQQLRIHRESPLASKLEGLGRTVVR